MEISRRSSVRSSTMENRYFRSSLRSKDSSSASDIAAREKIKDCCRKLVAFMCTQVGVGGLVVGYTVVGAFTFQYIETLEEKKELKIVSAARNICADVRLRSMLGSPAPPCPIRLYAVPGYDGRVNDIVYCHPAMRSEKAHTVVYFGGDMQDFTENMQSHRDSKNYLKWNLEDTARVIQTNFLDSHLIVIRPAKIEYKTFSCFKNFVPSNNCGAPEHTPMHFALQHLEKILQSVSEKLRTMTETELINAASSYNPVNLQDETDTEDCTIQTSDDLIPNSSNVCEKPTLEESFWWRENVHLDRNNLSLIGFSKGCVVLNQLLYEFHYLKTLTPDDQTSMDIVSRIKDMYWLDGGHSGGKNTWITSRPLLETFTRLGIQVHIHVTPYQIQDDRRPWIKKEEKLFAELLRRLGAPVNRTVHFENVCPNLFIHFDVINVFKLSDVAQTAAQCIDPQK